MFPEYQVIGGFLPISICILKMTLLPEIENDSSDIIGKMFSLDAECIKVSGIVEATLIVVSILLKQDYYSKTSLIT